MYISIVIPPLNRCELLCNTIASAWTQTFPADRYAPLPQHRRTSKEHAVLVAFPIGLQETVELLHCVINAFRQASNPFRIWLKPHPTHLPQERFLALLPTRGKLPEHFEVISGWLSDWLPQSDLLIYMSGSSVYDALALSIPAIHIVPETTIDLDGVTLRYHLPGFRIATTSQGLREAAIELLSLPNSEQEMYLRTSRQLVDRWFAPITESALKTFLPRGE